MKKLLKNRRGFTLLEMVSALFLLSLTLILAIPYAKEASVNYETKVTLRNAMQYFELIHKESMVNQEIRLVSFSGNKIHFFKDYFKPSSSDKTFVFPKESNFVSTITFTLASSGNISSETKTIAIKTNTRTYSVVFQLNGGRYRYGEQANND